jgi:hypothetical protein
VDKMLSGGVLGCSLTMPFFIIKNTVLKYFSRITVVLLYKRIYLSGRAVEIQYNTIYLLIYMGI